MPPLLQSAIGSVLRYLLTIIAVKVFVSHGVWTNAAAEAYVEGGVIFLLAFGWSMWKNYTQHRKVLTALAMPGGSTQDDLDTQILTKATPSISTPVNQTPVLPAKP
jgi:arginine exporter protein ArgO